MRASLHYKIDITFPKHIVINASFIYFLTTDKKAFMPNHAPKYLMNMWGNATNVHRLTLNVICHGEVCQAFYLDALLFNAECQQGWA